MGQGIMVQLVNATPYTWQISNCWNGDSKHSMNAWAFADVAKSVAPYSTTNVYIERANFWSSDDEAFAEYSVGNPGKSVFELHFKGGQLWAKHSRLQTRNLSKGSEIPLCAVNASGRISAWYVLSGPEDKFNSIGSVDSWMANNLSDLENKTLRELCLPCSHDAFMYELGGPNEREQLTMPAAVGSVLTQVLDIGKQLNAGMRWFDIRPVRAMSDRKWYTGHWTEAGGPLDWQGGFGPSLQTIVDDVNRFCVNHRELVILQIASDNTFIMDNVKLVPNYKPAHLGIGMMSAHLTHANDEEWGQILQLLCDENSGLHYRWQPSHAFKDKEKDEKDLTKVPMHEFIGERPAVIVIVKDGIDVDKFSGCFNKSAWPYKWAEEGKLGDSSDDPRIYSLCHTQGTGEAVENTIVELVSPLVSDGQGPLSIIYNASETARESFYELYRKTTATKFPAALSVDGVNEYSPYAALAMAFIQQSTK